jgi:phenylpropionate dioxygenase-like ring-hydroxylating dioxygenase large terminal subunit
LYERANHRNATAAQKLSLADMDAREDQFVWNAWYPLGSPNDISRQQTKRTWLLGREIDLTARKTRIEATCEGRALPVHESLGYAWTTLGQPTKPPQSLTEYSESDRITMNIWSTPLKCSGLRIVDNVIDNAHTPFVHPGILGDEAHLELPPHDSHVDEDGVLWSLDHQAWLPLINAVGHYTYRIAEPYTVILFIHRPRTEGERQRFDYIGIFAQPIDEENFILHKMNAWVKEDWMDPRQLRSDQQWIAAQDKYVLERHNPKKLPLVEDVEASISVDSASLAYRKWLLDHDVRYGAIRSEKRS